MGNSGKLCIILFVVCAVIYLLDNYNTVEYLTGLDSKLTAEQIAKEFSDKTGYTPQNNVVEKPSSYLSGFDLNETSKQQRDQMATLAPNSTDDQLIDFFGKQMAEKNKQTDFNVTDFLPKELNDEWFNTDLSKAQSQMDASTLIDVSTFCQGVDTIGQSLKNPSYDIRGNIPNPKMAVSPFLNSSYEPDTNIKSWC